MRTIKMFDGVKVTSKGVEVKYPNLSVFGVYKVDSETRDLIIRDLISTGATEVPAADGSWVKFELY